ncbi:hypothetical protein V1517DRAFT_332054 [Lipomyces orientalis]|uniref:Uncharacterized protein n=1 Tax=Lipomyces orientalis TaxID=1233043 RepID=A0ACC3TF40_9ASCO
MFARPAPLPFTRSSSGFASRIFRYHPSSTASQSSRFVTPALNAVRARGMSLFSSSAGATSGAAASLALSTAGVAATTLHPGIRKLMKDLDDLAPRFFLKHGQIDILKTPDEFYTVLKQKIASAKKRVFLATLYIGTTEHELIDVLRTALLNNPELKVFLLTDALRGTREAPNPSSASLMAKLVAEFGDRVEVRLFHTPNLRGMKKAMIPQRINEGWGLQHMKLYGFDDEIILSGANLSHDYFTNRQDRYFLFRSADITNYYKRIYDAVGSLSYALYSDDSQRGFRLSWPSTNPAPEPTKRALKFVKLATRILTPLIRSSHTDTSGELGLEDASTVTVLYPVSQFTPLLSPNTSTESPAVQHLLDALKTDHFSWTFTAGYFNIHPVYRDKLLSSVPREGTIITAAPEANGFYKSAGISGYLPPAYTALAMDFVKEVVRRHKSDKIHLLEWQNGVLNQPGGWTYHAKGIWISPPEADPSQEKPCITVIGSSNFTRRSHALDLESNVIIITRDEELRSKMYDEIQHLKQFTREMKEESFKSDDRRVGWGVKAALAVLGGML